jgi:hypothetical protein
MTDTKTLTQQLIAVHAALVEKTGEQPFVAPSLDLRQSGEWSIRLYRAYNGGKYEVGSVRSDTPEGCARAALDFIAALPSPEVKARTDWHGKLAAVIDEGHALNLPDDVMKPLRAGSQAMTENLLTYEAAK